MRWRGSIESRSVALGALTGINILNYVDRYVGAAILPLLLAALSLSDTAGGTLQSAFILTYALASPIAGWLGDRHPRLIIGTIGIGIWSCATIGSGLAPTYAVLLVWRAITGVGEASYAVVTPSVIADLYPSERRGRALAIFYAAIPCGTALGYGLGGAIGTAWGWRAAFLIAGAPGAALALALLLVREPPRGAFDQAATVRTRLGLGPSIQALRARPSYLFNTAGQAIYTFAVGGLATWMPTYFVRERGLTLTTTTWHFGAVLLLAGLGGTLLGGVVGDWAAHRARAGHFLVSGWTLMLSTVLTTVAVVSSNPTVYWPAIAGALLLVFLNVGPLNAAMTNVLAADLRARGVAIATMVTHLLGDAASPWLIGFVSDRVGLTVPVLGVGLMLGIAGLVLLLGTTALDRDLRREVRAN